MRENPGLDVGAIAASLAAHYGLDVASVAFLPLGYDFAAAVYKVISGDGTAWFLKVRFGPVPEPSLLVPRALIDRGVPNVLAPLRTRSGDLWCPLAGDPGPTPTIVLYPFIEGDNAMVAGMSDDQWRTFGSTLRAVHASGLEAEFRGRLPVETFALPSAGLVRRLLALVDGTAFEGAAAARFAAFWRENAERIRAMLERTEALGRGLQAKPFPHVLCHADIHAANILVGADGRIHLIDWDSPLIAPRERDLLFVVGSRIARAVEPREEALFFEGYGPVPIDPAALVYYRYERIVEDIGEFAKNVLLDPALGEPPRQEAADLAMGLFAPGGDLDRAETVNLRQAPGDDRDDRDD